MTRLSQARSLSVVKISKNNRRSQKKKGCLRKYAESTGNLELRPHAAPKGRLKCQQYAEYPHERNSVVESNYDPPKERWLALGLFSLLVCTQCCIWNTWGPIASSAIKAYPTWRKNTIALLSNWGCITYLSCFLPCCWLIHKKGLLIPLQMAAILSAIGAFLRCLSSQETIFTIIVHTAGILNGLAGVIIGPMITLLSAVWFQHGERTTATGISSACNQLGMAISYLIGPAVVTTSSIVNNSFTRQYVNSFSSAKLHYSPSDNVLTEQNTIDQLELRVQIISFMRIEFVAQFLVLLGVLCFFPKQPCYSVDKSDVPNRLTLVGGISKLLKNKNMWKLCLAAALSQGATGPWIVMITMTFGALITQKDADQLAFWTIISSSILSLVASRITDIYQGHLKIALAVLLSTSSFMFLWIVLLDNRILVFRKEELYVAVIFGISASWSTPALFLELASEIAFPVTEAIVGGYMIFLSNLIGSLFYFSYFVFGVGELWSSYCVFGNLIISKILVMCVKEEYNRTFGESQVIYKLYRCGGSKS